MKMTEREMAEIIASIRGSFDELRNKSKGEVETIRATSVQAVHALGSDLLTALIRADLAERFSIDGSLTEDQARTLANRAHSAMHVGDDGWQDYWKIAK